MEQLVFSNPDSVYTDEEKKMLSSLTVNRYQGLVGENVHEYLRALPYGIDIDEAESRICKAAGVKETHYPLIKQMFITDNEELFLQFFHEGYDFIYDDKSELFFVDLFSGHEIVRCNLYNTYKGVNLDYKDGAEKWVCENMGFFRSSVSPYIICGENYSIKFSLKPYIKERDIMRF